MVDGRWLILLQLVPDYQTKNEAQDGGKEAPRGLKLSFPQYQGNDE
jgi:hypothetical protein